jgi:hypothetical protein
MTSIKKEYTHYIEYRNEKGQLHNDNGPAIEWNDGTREWWINGKRHREDGPADEYPNGFKFWYLNGIEYFEQEWKQEVTKIKLKRILYL